MKTSDMDLRIEFQTLEKDRSAYRANIPGLSIRLVGGEVSATKDLSAGGTSFAPPEGMTFRQGQHLLLDILVVGRLYIQALESVVVRATPNITACAFHELTRVQEMRLDKLVLETQKRLIARRRAEEDERRGELQNPLDARAEGKNMDPIRLDD